VQIDAGVLGQASLTVDGVALDATSPFSVQLIPGSQHWFYSGGTYQYFSVAADGTVDYDPALEGALTGRGTSTLAINGRAVQIDAGVLGQASLTMDGVAYDATTPFTVQLIPGSQHWFYSGGTYQYFSVAADGTVDYDPALEGALTGRGTSTLAINGRAVQIDAGLDELDQAGLQQPELGNVVNKETDS